MRQLKDLTTSAWPIEKLEVLCAMWVEGFTMVDIGKHMGESKGSIIGKVYRLIQHGILAPRTDHKAIKKPGAEIPETILAMPLEPPARPPPEPEDEENAIEEWLDEISEPEPEQAPPVLEVEPPAERRGNGVARPPLVARQPRARPPIMPRPAITAPAPRPPTSAPVARARSCQYVIDDTPMHWQFCGAPSLRGYSWCEAHCRRVFDRFDLAAARRRGAAMSW